MGHELVSTKITEEARKKSNKGSEKEMKLPMGFLNRNG
jgi:hypothetical protein